MYNYPYGGDPGEAWGALAGAFACAAFFTLVLVILYLWLFYRIFSKAGYSGWYTLLNLIPYVGSVIVLFMLAFGDWPALRRQVPPSYGPTGGYPPPTQGYGSQGQQGGYVPPVAPPPQQPYAPPQQSAPPVEQPPAPGPVLPDSEPPAPPA